MWHRVKTGSFYYREHAYRHFWPVSRLVENYYRHAGQFSFCLVRCSSLAHFLPLGFFYTSWKYQKTTAFRIFSGGIERDQWHEMAFHWLIQICFPEVYHCYNWDVHVLYYLFTSTFKSLMKNLIFCAVLVSAQYDQQSIKDVEGSSRAVVGEVRYTASHRG